MESEKMVQSETSVIQPTDRNLPVESFYEVVSFENKDQEQQVLAALEKLQNYCKKAKAQIEKLTNHTKIVDVFVQLSDTPS
jgi:predicted enzyme involved in methoxymalonyl-ACP biosynthesis